MKLKDNPFCLSIIYNRLFIIGWTTPCPKGCTVRWESQPRTKFVKGQGNIDLVAAITFAGIPLSKFLQFAWIMKLKCLSGVSFYQLRNQYVTPVIRKRWDEVRTEVGRIIHIMTYRTRYRNQTMVVFHAVLCTMY